MKVVIGIAVLLFCPFAMGDYPLEQEELISLYKMIEAEQIDQTIEELNTLSQTNLYNADVWNLLGYAKRKKGDLSGSELAYQQALNLEPNHKAALSYQGELFLMQGERDKALANLKKLNDLCSDLPSLQCAERNILKQAIKEYKN